MNDTPSQRCAKAMHNLGLAVTKTEDLLAKFIAEQTGCDKMMAACEEALDALLDRDQVWVYGPKGIALRAALAMAKKGAE